MPRKKTGILDDILNYVANAPLSAVDVVLQLCGTIVKNRHIAEEPRAVPTVVKRKKRQKKSEAVTLPPTPAATTAPVADVLPTAPKRERRKRMTVNSPRPVSEATPIVPLQETVGDEAAADDPNAALTYSGN